MKIEKKKLKRFQSSADLTGGGFLTNRLAAKADAMAESPTLRDNEFSPKKLESPKRGRDKYENLINK